MSDLQQRLRRAADTLRRTSMPLADLIPLLQQAADALEAQPAQAVPLLTDDERRKLLDRIGRHTEGLDGETWDQMVIAAVEQAVRSKLGAAVGWQPIETAPRDGVEILLGRPDGSITVGRRAESDNSWDSDIGWIDWPTHWQPLPPPPDNKTETTE